MHKLTIIVVSVAVVFVTFGCSSTSDIKNVSESESHFKDAVYKGRDFYVAEESVEGERYRIFHQASSGFSGTSGIRKSATVRAKMFCKEMEGNKVMFKLSEHTASPPYVLGNFPRIEIIFACVEKRELDPVISHGADKYDQLEKIKLLYDDDVLTKDEFEIEKKKILSE